LTRPLESDGLGEKGERRFAELCADARLVANKSDRDRVGWDYVVTWPLDNDAPLDSRPAPITCHVQVKTVWVGNDTITLNLGTFENIVKDSRPAFIVVLEVEDPDLTFVGARLIHVAGDFLAEILKRLRQAQADGLKSVGLTYQASAAKWGLALGSVTGAALRPAMDHHVADGMVAYARHKERQLAELGYQRGRLKVRTTVEAASIDEAIDGFLGLRPLRVAGSQYSETRFGIAIDQERLPWTGEHGGDEEPYVAVSPRRIDRCEIRVVRDRDEETVPIAADLFKVPVQVTGPNRLVFEARGPLLRVRLDVSDSSSAVASSILFAATAGIEDAAATTADWAAFYRIGAWAISEPLTIQISPRRGDGPPPIKGGVAPVPDLEEARHYEVMAYAADAAHWAMARAQAPDTKLTSHQLLEAAEDFELLRLMEQSPNNLSPLTFTTDAAPTQPSDHYDMLYINRIMFGDRSLAYAARTRMTATSDGNVITWTSGPLHLAIVRKVKSNEKAMAKFAKDARWLTGVSASFGPSEMISMP
jgi:hypothetical protein